MMMSQRSHCFAYGSKHHSPGRNCFMARGIYGKYSVDTTIAKIVTLQVDFVAFGGGEQVYFAAHFAGAVP